MADEIVFYTNPQSRGLTTHWMLEEIGCPYRMVIKAYGPEMKSPDYLAINPMGKGPASGPRPTSSMPAMHSVPCGGACCAWTRNS